MPGNTSKIYIFVELLVRVVTNEVGKLVFISGWATYYEINEHKRMHVFFKNGRKQGAQINVRASFF